MVEEDLKHSSSTFLLLSWKKIGHLAETTPIVCVRNFVCFSGFVSFSVCVCGVRLGVAVWIYGCVYACVLSVCVVAVAFLFKKWFVRKYY